MTIRPAAFLRRAGLPASISLLLLLTACSDAPESVAVPVAPPVNEVSDARAQGHEEGMEMERDAHERGMESGRDAHANAAGPTAIPPGGSMPMDHDMPMPANPPAVDSMPMKEPAKAPMQADPKADPPMEDMDDM